MPRKLWNAGPALCALSMTWGLLWLALAVVWLFRGPMGAHEAQTQSSFAQMILTDVIFGGFTLVHGFWTYMVSTTAKVHYE